MYSRLRTPLAALALSVLTPTAVLVSALAPTAAIAQRAPATPEIGRLEVNSDGGLSRGAELSFKLEASPGANASLVVRANRPITVQLRETQRGSGIYTGAHVVRINDRIREGDRLNVTLRQGKRVAHADFEVPAGADRQGWRHRDGRDGRQDRTFGIERFTSSPVGRLEPGTELVFTLEGTPGASASFNLDGIASGIPMRELRPGVYEGRYTLRRQDRLSTTTPVVANLRAGDRTVSANLVWPNAAPVDNRAPQVTRILPADGAQVPAGSVTISAALQDVGPASGVDARSVRVMLNGRDVTPNTQIGASGFTTTAVLNPGRYDVQVLARDMAGNEVRRNWGFEVVPMAMPSPPLAIQLNTPSGTVVDGRSPVAISGRTASNALVQATVTALVRGPGPIGVSQQVYAQTVQADAAGQFAFNFQPIMAPGVVYDVVLVATQNGRREESRLRIDQR